MNYIEKLNAAINDDTITTLNLGYNNIGEAGVKKLAQVLKDTLITTLDLGSNNIREAGVKELAQGLKDTHITTLHLQGNKIGEAGVKKLAQALKDTLITTLHLQGNKIGEAGVKKLAQVLKDTLITTLHLSYNKIGEAGVKELAQVLKDTLITTLNLSDNNIGDAGVKKLAQVLKDTLITTLHLSYNKIGEAGVKELAQVLKDTLITTLNLSDNNIGDAGVKELAQVLKDTLITTLHLGVRQLDSHILLLNAEIDNKLKKLKLVDNLHDILRSDSNDNLEFYINNTDNGKESVMNIIRWVDSVQTHYMQSTDIMRSRFVCLIKAECKVSEKQITNLTDNIIYKLIEFIGMYTAGVDVGVVDKVIGVDDYAKILSQCEREEVSATIMKELLSQRIYIPETKILHPLVLTLLSKYDMLTLQADMLNPTPQEMIQCYKGCDDQDKDASDAAINVVYTTMLEYYENHLDLLDTPEAIALLGELVPIM